VLCRPTKKPLAKYNTTAIPARDVTMEEVWKWEGNRVRQIMRLGGGVPCRRCTLSGNAVDSKHVYIWSAQLRRSEDPRYLSTDYSHVTDSAINAINRMLSSTH
jgi:hypothetical protein